MDIYKTYLVSYVTYDNNDISKFGNCVFATQSTGQQLALDAINLVENECPNSVILSISKLD